MNVEPFTIPLTDPLRTASGSIEERRGFLVRCEHRDTVGVGEATPLPGWTESTDACRAALEDATTVTETDGIDAALRRLPRSAIAARHGVSTAILDADARADGLPLSDWLAGTDTATTVPVNATIGDGDPSVTGDRAATAVDAGFSRLKLKVGARSVEGDRRRLASVRDAVGGDVELRIDANGSWTGEEAERAIDAMIEQSVSTVEQPLAADDLAGHADLRERGVDVALDESLASTSPGAIVEAGAADVLVLKPMVLGGPGEAHTLAGWARERGLDVIVTTTLDAVVARTAAVHVAAAIPDVPACGLATAARLETDLGADPAPVSEGSIAVPDGPGLGLGTVSVDD